MIAAIISTVEIRVASNLHYNAMVTIIAVMKQTRLVVRAILVGGLLPY